MLLVFVSIILAISALCAVTIFACASCGGSSLSHDLSEEPIRQDPPADKPEAAHQVATSSF